MDRHELWLQIAQEDLFVVQSAWDRNEERSFGRLIYNAQQCAEKAFKAFLVFHRIPIIKTHDLEKLIEECRKIDQDFVGMEDHAAWLSPMVTEYRYPRADLNELIMPTRDEFEMAVLSAQAVLDFVIKKISESTI